MNAWRVILTDSESETGVAPVCDDPMHPMAARLGELIEDSDGPHVFDCCPHPHIEMWDEAAAKELAARLTALEARLCS